MADTPRPDLLADLRQAFVMLEANTSYQVNLHFGTRRQMELLAEVERQARVRHERDALLWRGRRFAPMRSAYRHRMVARRRRG